MIPACRVRYGIVRHEQAVGIFVRLCILLSGCHLRRELVGVHCPGIGKGHIVQRIIRQSVVHRVGNAHAGEVKVIDSAGSKVELLVDFIRGKRRRRQQRQHHAAQQQDAEYSFLHWLFLLLFVSVRFVRPVFFLVFSVSEPNAQCDDDHRRCKGDDSHQHIAACVLPQQHRAEHAPCFRLPRPDDRARRLRQDREQQHTHSTQSIYTAPLLPAGFFPHPLLDECDPSCGVVHFA